MSDDLVERMKHVLSAVATSPARIKPGVGGQTLEETAKTTTHDISDWQLETLFEAYERLVALEAINKGEGK